jgi:methylmalonyl-CoA carboxyltransferase 12S subunit
MAEKKTPSRRKTADASAEILARLERIEERLATLEAARAATVATLVAPIVPFAPRSVAAPPERIEEARQPHGPAPREEIGAETLLVIAASVAAFLGERAHVRHVRLVSSDAWAQQGRAGAMAAHWLIHR